METNETNNENLSSFFLENSFQVYKAIQIRNILKIKQIFILSLNFSFSEAK